MPLSRKLAQLLRGDVSVKSVLGSGSEFALDIPQEWESEAALPEVTESENPSGLPLLIVENRTETLAMYSQWLNRSRW